MEEQGASMMNPNYVPEEYKIPYDVIELPSQGILYPGERKSIRVEYLTTFDENILGSPNLKANGKVFDVLLKTKIKDLDFDPLDLLEGDRLAILIYLRSTGLGHIYTQPVVDPESGKVVAGEIDLTKLKHKKLSIKPDKSGEFDYKTKSGTVFKFKLLTGRDYESIDQSDKALMSRSQDPDKYSQKKTLTLERHIKEVNGERDALKLRRIIGALPPKETRELSKYIDSIDPGIDFKCDATIPGGGSVSTFLRLGWDFFYPDDI
jgi:hypothetical protein